MSIFQSILKKRGSKIVFTAFIFCAVVVLSFIYNEKPAFASSANTQEWNLSNTYTGTYFTNGFPDAACNSTSVYINGIWNIEKVYSYSYPYATTTDAAFQGNNYSSGILGSGYLNVTSYPDGFYFIFNGFDNSSLFFSVSSGVVSCSSFSPTPFLPPNTQTRIIDFTPENNATSTNPVSFSLHGYVNPADIGTYIGVAFTLHNIDQNVLILSAFSPNDIVFLNGFQATTSGDFYYSTSTTIAEGNYRINAKLVRSYLSSFGFSNIFNFFSPIDENLSHQFIVCGASDLACQGTFIGGLTQNGYNELNQIFASTTATSTAAAAQNCNLLNISQFDVIKCGAFLFIPGGQYLTDSVSGLRDGVLTRVPWGYFTRIVTIFQSTTTNALPTFTATIKMGAGNDTNISTTSLTFDPGDMISGGATLLNSVTDPYYGKNVKDIFSPLLELIIGASVVLTIFSDLTGSHAHHKENNSDNNTKLS